MHIAVIGGGAVGLLSSAYLRKSHHVTVVTRRREQAVLLNEQGIKLVREGQEEFVPITATSDTSTLHSVDEVWIAVKQTHLDDVMATLMATPPLLRAQRWVFLQNGIGHLRYKTEQALPSLHFGVVEHGIWKSSDASVHHKGIGNIRIDKSYKPPVQDSSFPFTKEENIEVVLRQKLLVNLCINPLTSLLQCPNGALVNNDHLRATLRTLVSELSPVIGEDSEAMWAYTTSIIDKTRHNISSMAQDVARGTTTEMRAFLKDITDLSGGDIARVAVTHAIANIVLAKEGEV